MYCRDVAAAVDYALTRQMRVVFVTQPHPTTGRIRERHLSQQRAVAAMLQQRYASRIAYADLGNAVDLGDATLAFDGMHLTASGNARIADGLVQPILQLSQAARSSAP
jgi:lysophospholipase L1-like esterase